jgi:hypothetical protein
MYSVDYHSKVITLIPDEKKIVLSNDTKCNYLYTFDISDINDYKGFAIKIKQNSNGIKIKIGCILDFKIIIQWLLNGLHVDLTGIILHQGVEELFPSMLNGNINAIRSNGGKLIFPHNLKNSSAANNIDYFIDKIKS